jgi:general secretion pathway protein A
VRYHIPPLEKSELPDYIRHRLNVAGADNTLSFSPEAIDEIYQFSNGTPRLVNILCDRALLAGFVAETHVIDNSILRQCIDESRQTHV